MRTIDEDVKIETVNDITITKENTEQSIASNSVLYITRRGLLQRTYSSRQEYNQMNVKYPAVHLSVVYSCAE